jgi:organic radical activating enzyme
VTAVASIHDYTAKLRRPEVWTGVEAALCAFEAPARPASLADALRCRHAATPGPISINIDLTVACNYRCPHCIDAPILNSGRSYQWAELVRSLVVLRLAGLRSVILIGGGEPTLHPRFRDAVRAIKLLGLQCAVVSNGSNNARLREVAPLLTDGDWIRLSLDAGSDETFRTMHLPQRAGLTLADICASAGEVKRANPRIALGFSYIVTWRGASVCGEPIADNLGEMVAAARLAKQSGFDFIAFKPLLDRDEIGAETIQINGAARDAARREAFALRIAGELLAARALEDERFKVFGSVNLRGLTRPDEMTELRTQPRRCHMRLFRQVLTPLGVYGCPAYRGNDKDRVGAHAAYESIERFFESRRRTCELVEQFDASVECRNVACIYNAANWWLQSVRDGQAPSPTGEAAADYFL